MDEATRIKLHKEQTDNLYRAIGKFVVKFEYLVFTMRSGIGFILSRYGLAEQQLSNILLAELTAQPTKQILASMVPQIVDLSEKEKKILKSILNRIQSLIDKRNAIIHSTWFVGWAKATDITFDTAHGFKLTRERQGIGSKSFAYESEDFDKLSVECEILAEFVGTLYGAVVRGAKIQDEFGVSEEGEITSLWGKPS